MLHLSITCLTKIIQIPPHIGYNYFLINISKNTFKQQQIPKKHMWFYSHSLVPNV
uniref:Uncharacterized protein n=1 Tax=Octopus bimaculoides TaxID=37653 RepID=A0A0L8GY91_OCTBM